MSDPQIPATQKAWVVERRGIPALALRLRTDWPVSSILKPGEVLVKVQAAALNPAGHKTMMIIPNFLSYRPAAAELDFAGTIVNGNGTSLKNRDQVFGFVADPKSDQGSLSQYVRVPASDLVLRPENVSPTEAAGIAASALSSYTALVKVAQLEAGQTVFINGGSSAVGTAAIQIAKALGARVVASASGVNGEFVLGLGADQFVDYTKEPLHIHLAANPPSPKYNVIFDAVGLVDPSLYTHSPAYLAPGGMFISSGPLPKDMSASELWKMARTIKAITTPTWLGGTRRTYSLLIVKEDKSYLDAIQALVASGALKPRVDSVYEFEDALKAYDRIMTGRATGKVTVRIDPDV